MEATWEKVAPDFEPDGSLRDIYVHDTTIADWDLVLGVLRRDFAPLLFMLDGNRATLPASAADAFAKGAHATVSLDFEVGGIELACHFFTPTEIEFDLPPEQVNSRARFSALLAFLRTLAAILHKPVLLSPESAPHLRILEVQPTGLAVYNPPSDLPAT